MTSNYKNSMYPRSFLYEEAKIKQCTSLKKELREIGEEAIWESRFTSFFTYSSHTEYVKRESIVIAWVKKKFSPFDKCSWFVCLRRENKPKYIYVYIYIYLKKNLNWNVLGISTIKHAISGVKNCNLNKLPWRVGVRNTMKNFSAPKSLAYA